MSLRTCASTPLTPWRTTALLAGTFGVSVAVAVGLAAADGEVTPISVRAGIWDGVFNTVIIAIVAAGVVGGRMTRRATAP